MSAVPAVPQLSLVNGHPVVTSLNLAEVFGKKHCDVLRTIRQLEIDDDFGRRNFASSSYINEQNKPQPMYNITRDGFTLLVMGFTGAKAMQFKLAYIEAFNKMEAELAARHEAQQAGSIGRLEGLLEAVIGTLRSHSQILANLTGPHKPAERKPRNTRREFTRDEEEYIIRMRALDMPYADIARRLDRSPSSVKHFCYNPPERLKRLPQQRASGMMSLPMSPALQGKVEYVQTSLFIKRGAK